jgi:crotonobetainyl-CoA:carnitine CoA-transferase CaiB-like acyl-CoA transferase/ABC-type polysaccharide/polyol phosphate transport system ATPase subunit
MTDNARIDVTDVSVFFPLYHGSSRSLKKTVMAAASGRLGQDRQSRVVVEALRHITFSLGSGDRLGLIGMNGAGKTTLLRTLAGIYEPVMGRVRVQGVLSTMLDTGLGMNVELTGRENIQLRGLYSGLNRAELPRLEEDVAAFSELGDFMDLPMRTYSAGMVVRLSFALATAIRPQILLMDEWFLAGDAEFLEKAQARLESVVRGAEILVLSTHLMPVVRQWCTRVLWLDQGRIIADGAPDDVIRCRHRYRRRKWPRAEGLTGMTILPLDGLTVLEFSHTVMGPSCGVVLADLGADVIRVEPAPDGDRTRRLHGFATGFFAYFNRNKRCICIDAKSADGLAVAQDLVRNADVLIENFGPGTMDRLGLGWNALHALNPRLIYCALKGFLPGPYEHRPSLDEIAQYMTGLAYMTGPPGQPLRAGASVIDIMGGVMGALAILAALRQRDKDGQGRNITSALYESSAFLVGQHMAGEAATGTPPPPMPARSGAWGIYETFPTLNGEKLFIGITSDNHWRSFCAKFDRPDLLADDRFTSNADRVRNRPALRDIVAAIVAGYAIADLERFMDEANIPFSPVRTPSDLFDDPQLNAFGRALPVRMPNGNVANLPGLPFCIDDEAPSLRMQPPSAGEHTDAILAALGYSPDRIERLRSTKAIA